ncbi:MAG: phage tail assembly protein [Sulfurospirillum sp.]|nr:phage tail assembly protein [Sulfurospirillum sp.]
MKANELIEKMREPSLGDIMAVDSVTGDTLKEVTLVSNLTGYTVEEIKTLPFKEYKKVQEKLQTFLS